MGAQSGAPQLPAGCWETSTRISNGRICASAAGFIRLTPRQCWEATSDAGASLGPEPTRRCGRGRLTCPASVLRQRRRAAAPRAGARATRSAAGRRPRARQPCLRAAHRAPPPPPARSRRRPLPRQALRGAGARRRAGGGRGGRYGRGGRASACGRPWRTPRARPRHLCRPHARALLEGVGAHDGHARGGPGRRRAGRGRRHLCPRALGAAAAAAAAATCAPAPTAALAAARAPTRSFEGGGALGGAPTPPPPPWAPAPQDLMSALEGSWRFTPAAPPAPAPGAECEPHLGGARWPLTRVEYEFSMWPRGALRLWGLRWRRGPAAGARAAPAAARGFRRLPFARPSRAATAHARPRRAQACPPRCGGCRG